MTTDNLLEDAKTMRRRNWRFVATGVLFIVLAVGFFFFMTLMAPQSTDPAEMMRIVGQASGVVVGISVVLIILGLIGKKAQ
jgi:multidrug resistance efflux pump